MSKMKRALLLCGIALATVLALCFVVVPLCREWFKSVGVIFGLIVMVLAIPWHILGKRWKPMYVLSISFNVIGTALAISDYYTHIKATPGWREFLVAAAVPTAFLLLVTLAVRLFYNHSEKVCTLGLGLNLLLGIAYIVFWIIKGGVFFSFGYFMMTVAFMYTVALLVFLQEDRSSMMRYASFAGFGYLIAIAVVVIAIVSEGGLLDGLDLLDIDLPGFGKKKGKKAV